MTPGVPFARDPRVFHMPGSCSEPPSSASTGRGGPPSIGSAESPPARSAAPAFAELSTLASPPALPFPGEALDDESGTGQA